MASAAPYELDAAFSPRARVLAEPERAAPLVVATVDDPRGLDALETDWNALLERSDASVFQSFEWSRTWWTHFGEGDPGAHLHVVIVRDRGRLVAVAPLYVETLRVLGIARLKRLLFIGHRDSDYLDVLAERGREAEVAEVLAEHLCARSDLFGMVVLEEISERSRVGALLHEALVRSGWTSSRIVDEQCPETRLGGTWEETVAAFRIDHRREIRRRLRNMAKAFRVELEVVQSGPEVQASMREFIAMHQERWGHDGHSGAFADRRVADFHVDVAGRLASRGWLALAFLRLDGARRAASYGFAFRDAVATYQTGTRGGAELARYSPGRVLHASCMQWAIRQGRTRYDFMRGAEPYKYELEAVDVPNWTIVAYPRRAPLVAAAHRLAAAQETVQRRVNREAHALRVAAASGWLSAPLRRHVGRAIGRGLGDVRRVVLREDRYARPGA